MQKSGKKFEVPSCKLTRKIFSLFTKAVKIGGVVDTFCRSRFLKSGKCMSQASATTLPLEAFSYLYCHGLKSGIMCILKFFLRLLRVSSRIHPRYGGVGT